MRLVKRGICGRCLNLRNRRRQLVGFHRNIRRCGCGRARGHVCRRRWKNGWNCRRGSGHRLRRRRKRNGSRSRGGGEARSATEPRGIVHRSPFHIRRGGRGNDRNRRQRNCKNRGRLRHRHGWRQFYSVRHSRHWCVHQRYGITDRGWGSSRGWIRGRSPRRRRQSKRGRNFRQRRQGRGRTGRQLILNVGNSGRRRLMDIPRFLFACGHFSPGI